MYDIFLMNIRTIFKDSYITPPFYNSVRYYNSHLETIRRCVNKATTEYIWVISDICDYTNFDFNYRPMPWESKQIHCWASGTEQRGDTFLIPVDEFKKQEPLKKLEYFKDIHYHYPGVHRVHYTIQRYDDNLPDSISNNSFDYYTLFKTSDGNCSTKLYPCMWEDRKIHVLNKSGSRILVPYDCNGKKMNQVYDYPYIQYDIQQDYSERPLDVVYISNGEEYAQRNYDILKNIPTNNHLFHVKDINDRETAYKMAAASSKTPWFFAVFAKCDVNKDFDFGWQPDYLQGNKHYIFHSKNLVNGLEYGHMGIIAYNKKLVLETTPNSLDFTLQSPHSVVPIVSCTSTFNETPFSTWRTAFREVTKLLYMRDNQYTVETEYRLHIWLTKAEGLNSEYSLMGSEDAGKYYNEVHGNLKELMNTYNWNWLKDRFIQEMNLRYHKCT